MKHIVIVLLSLLLGLPVSGKDTFTNPVIWTDMPDPDVTEVRDTFYMVSTSMHLLPGVTIMRSTDLVHWSIAANVVPQFDNDPYFNLEGGNRYGKGQWATAIRYWGGEFHVLFTSNTNGTFIYSSPTMSGKWRKTIVYAGPYHPVADRVKPLKEQDMGDGFSHHILYDPGFLVDDDGRVYVFHGGTINYVTELDPVTLQPLHPAKKIYQAHREGLEGNRPYHIGDYYYLICTYGGDLSGNVTCLRSRSIYGPWEEREVMSCGARMADAHILQACLIPLRNGQTWAMAFLGMGALGRVPHLIPVHWIDGWPVFGNWSDGNVSLNLPLNNSDNTDSIARSDDFASPRLGLQWQFNHNPDNSRWSLTERKGYLRLHAQLANKPLRRKDVDNPLINNGQEVSRSSVSVSPSAPLLMARNTLTQRLFGPESYITAKVDASNLVSGDRAGLAMLNIPYATLTLVPSKGSFMLSQTVGDNNSEKTIAEVRLTKEETRHVWLRMHAKAYSDVVDFSYSLDGRNFIPLGRTFHMEYSPVYFVGNRPALFCYSTRGKGGFIDVDDFQVNVLPLFNRTIHSGEELQAAWTDVLWRTECRWSDNNVGDKHGSETGNMDVAWTGDGGMIAFNDLQYADSIGQLVFILNNISGHNVLLEVKDGTTEQVLGTATILEPTAGYVAVPVTLSKPLASGHRLCIRIWNRGWNVPSLGEVRINTIRFYSAPYCLGVKPVSFLK